MGTCRVSPSARCLRARRSRGLPLLVHAAAGPWFGVRQSHVAPPAGFRELDEVVYAQVDAFFGSQAGVVHGAEERFHALAALAVRLDGGEEPAGMLAVDDDARVDGGQGARLGPFHCLERVRGEDIDLAGVFHRVVDDHSLAVGGVSPQPTCRLSSG